MVSGLTESLDQEATIEVPEDRFGLYAIEDLCPSAVVSTFFLLMGCVHTERHLFSILGLNSWKLLQGHDELYERQLEV